MAPRADGLTLALPKGRILKQALPLLRRVGIDLAGVWEGEHDRRLLVELPGRPELPGGARVLLVKPVDVPTYVEHGVADVGIAGADTLGEEARDLYEPLDLGIGACRLVVAEPAARPTPLRRGMALRVATKYPRLTLNHYRSKGIQPEIIPLFGSVELGPITGLAEQIVDLVESGETLRQNNLREVETILYVTSRLIVHPASLKLKQAPITALITALRDALATDGSGSSARTAARPIGSEGTA
ncbi:ATP phosphoribosyltransferase [Nannocystis sp. ILAH1]|uniref:ATP phosphoribosyltransferase n=1 Tax=unclassified Nannocystis TaxID=2627009 RepID=UPI00226E8C64|nr:MULTISPECIES: ATP phosphoribosyltransferase [unclassified Nannocystis]MCY0990889.1 ATP phosphoribosyltransferase [Nannocystis sp. ILAH1]MCY1072418.1 ATP phosphoribosyltransferase [Nannocystis sp. RBIL2]